MTSPTVAGNNRQSPALPQPDDGEIGPPPAPEEPPPQIEEYKDDEPIKEEEEGREGEISSWRPYSPYNKAYSSESLTNPKHLSQKATSLIKRPPENSSETNGHKNTPPTNRSHRVQILPHDIHEEDIESHQLTCQRAKCPFLLGMLLGLTVLLCIGIVIAWAILSDGFQNLGGLSRTCSSKDCIELAFQITESIDPTEKVCDNFYRYSCGHFHASNPPLPGKTIDFTTKLQDNLENRLNEIFMNTSPANANPFSLQFSYALYQACTNPIRPSLQALPLVNLLKNLPCSPMLPFCSGFSSEYFSWERYTGMMDWYAGPYNLILYDRGSNPQSPGQILLTFSAIDLYEILNPIKSYVSSLGPKNPTEFEALLGIEIKQKLIQNAQNLLQINVTDRNLLDIDELIKLVVELDNLSTWAKQTADNSTVMPLQEFSQLIEPIDLKAILDAGLSSTLKWSWSDPVVVNRIEYFRALPRLLSNFSKRTIANYLTIMTTLNLRKYLQFEPNDDSWRICLKEMSALQPVASVYAHSRNDLEFGKLFMFFNDLKKFFIKTNHQFEPPVLDTLQRVSIKVGVPRKILDESYLSSMFSNINIDPEDYFNSFIRAMKTQRANELGRIGSLITPDDAINWPSLEPSLVMVDQILLIPIAMFQAPPLAIPLSNAPLASIFATTVFLFYQMMYRIARNLQPEPFSSIVNCASNVFGQFVMPGIENPNEFLIRSVEQLYSIELVRLSYRQWASENKIVWDQTLPSFDKLTTGQLMLIQYGTLMCSTAGAVRGSPYEAMVNTVASMTSDFTNLFTCPRNSRMKSSISCPISKPLALKESIVEPFK